MIHVPLTESVPLDGDCVIDRLAAAPPESDSAIGTLVEFSSISWVESLATGTRSVVEGLTAGGGRRREVP